MKRLLLLTFLLALFAPGVHAQSFELTCPSGTTPSNNPNGLSFDPSTGKYRQWLCVNPATGQYTFNDATSGLPTVSALPGTCTPGTSVNLVINGIGYGIFTCSGNNVFIPDNPAQTISPYMFGALGHVRFTYNASWASGVSTVSCSNGECNFQCPNGSYPCTSATTGCPSLTCDAGKIVKGASATQGVQVAATTGGVTVPQGIISTVTNSTTITVSTTTTALCPNGSLSVCTLSWGIQDDTTPLTNSVASAWGNGNRCLALQIPSDYFYFSGPIFNAPTLLTGNPCSTNGTGNNPGTGSDITVTGPSLYGAGPASSVFIPLSNYNFAGCTFGTFGNSCNGTMPNLQAHDFGINGLGDTVGGTHANVLWDDFGSNAGNGCAGGTTLFNVNLSGWGLNAISLIGLQFGKNGCGTPPISNVNATMFGSITCDYEGSGSTFAVYNLLCFGGNPSALGLTNSPANSQLDSFASVFSTPLAAGNLVTTFSGSGSPPKWSSTADIIGSFANGTTAAFNLISVNGQNIDLNEDQLVMNSNTVATSTILAGANNNESVHARNTLFLGTGTNNRIFNMGATDKFFDDGGNTFTNGSVANTFGPMFGITNSVNGTACATVNFALTSGWGTSSLTSVATNGNILGCHVTITGAAGATGPVLTWTYPSAPLLAPGSCHLSGVSGTLTGVSAGTPGTTSVAYTFTGTPSAQTYSFDVGCP